MDSQAFRTGGNMDDSRKEILEQLAALGQELAGLREAKTRIELRMNEVIRQQDKLVGALPAIKSPEPNEEQKRLLGMYERVCATGVFAAINPVYSLCLMAGCDKTNWRSDMGENLLAHFERIVAPQRVA
jgi:hypothetical protein